MGAGFAAHAGMRGPGRMSFAGAPRFNHGFIHSNHGFGHSPHRPFFGQRRHFGGNHPHHFRYAVSPFGYATYPYYAGYGSPFLWDWENASYGSRDDYRDAIYEVQYRTEAEINRLADEIERLREERAYPESSPEPAPPLTAQPQAAATQSEETLPIVLVFLDKRIQEVKNYAVANEMLVVLDGSKRKKFPLADIDLAATMKLNDERGVDFQVPNPIMTQ
jgi:hypothetical protein